MKKKNSDSNKGKKPPPRTNEHSENLLKAQRKRLGLSFENQYGIEKANQIKLKISEKAKAAGGHPQSEESKKKISEWAKRSGLGGYKKGSGRGKKGWYKGFFCDSSWELAFVIYCLEHDISIIRNTEKRQYVWNDLDKNYIPDFIVNGVLTEIKGYKTAQWLAKLSANSDVKVLYEQELKPIFKYVIERHGKDFISLYDQTKKHTIK